MSSLTPQALVTAIDVTESADDTYTDYSVQGIERISIQTIAVDSDPDAVTFVAADVTPSTFATGTITVVSYADLSGATLTVNGTALVEGVDWTAAVDNATTAASLELAVEAVTNINSSAASAVITATYATAGTVGNAVTLETSDAVNLTISGATFEGGEDLSTIDAPAHGFVTGLKVPLTGTNLPTGLSATNYWAIVVDADTLRLASSYANAILGTFVIITAAGTTNDAALTPSALGSSEVEVLASLDGINYFSFDTPKTITITTTANAFLDCGQVTYPWVRVQWTAPTAGALTLQVLVWATNTQVRNRS